MNVPVKLATTDITADDLGPVTEGLAYAAQPIFAAARELTERLGLGRRGAFILNLIANGIEYPTDLADFLKTKRSLITADLSRLKGAGLIAVAGGDADRRRSRLVLTPAGEAARRDIKASIEATLRRNLGHYSREEIALFARMLADARKGVGG